MAEIYLDQASRVVTKIYWAGEITDADGAVTAEVKRCRTSSPQWISAANTYTATKLESDAGTYEIIIPKSEVPPRFWTNTLEITWRYSINGVQTSHKQIVEVVRPYVNITDAIEILNVGTDASDPNFKSYNELKIAERYARKLIDVYTNQFFDERYIKESAYGDGTNTLPLKSRLLETTYILREEDIVVIDRGLSLNNFGYTIKVSDTEYGVYVDRANLLDNIVYTANGMVPPTINDLGSGAFKKGYKYTAEGWYGWTHVPSNVSEACLVLMQQYFEKDRAWKDKYVKNISTFDWKFEFLDKAHTGTGNLYADQLLAPYVVNGMVVI
jgi:hypothetical protein